MVLSIYWVFSLVSFVVMYSVSVWILHTEALLVIKNEAIKC